MLSTRRGENRVNYKVLYRKYRPSDFDNLVTLPKDYYISIKDKESAEQQDANLTINANGVFEFPITMDKAGIYEVTVTEKEPINILNLV